MPELGVYIDRLDGGIDDTRARELAGRGHVQRFYLNVQEHLDVELERFRVALAGTPARVYGWVNVYGSQADAIAHLARAARLGGLLLDVEKPSQGQDLRPLLTAARSYGVPVCVSLGGFKMAELAALHYQAMEGFELEWQAYLDSGEGASPADCVRSLYQPRLLVVDGLGGRTYRIGLDTEGGGVRYVWHRGVGFNADQAGYFSFVDVNQPATRRLVRAYVDGGAVYVFGGDFRRVYTPQLVRRGTLLGFCPYVRVRIALDVSSAAAVRAGRTPAQWAELAASSRFPGAAIRGVSLFREANLTDETIAAVRAALP